MKQLLVYTKRGICGFSEEEVIKEFLKWYESEDVEEFGIYLHDIDDYIYLNKKEIREVSDIR